MLDTSIRNDDGRLILAGESAAVTRLESQITRVAKTPKTTVLLTGARGIEFGLVARAIHARPTGAGGERAFAGLRCRDLRGGELAAGSSLFEGARYGTLFLDEVGELADDCQGELLGQLEERAAAGDRADGPRVVAATSVDLEREVEAGRFRTDLFYRLNVLTVRVPSLLERSEDIVALASELLRSTSAVLGRDLTLGVDAASALADHDWPLGLFELRSTIEGAAVRAALHGDGGTIRTEHLGLEGSGEPGNDWLAPSSRLEPRALRDLEEITIRRVLQEEDGNRSRAARVLGINRTTLYNKLRQYGIDG